MKLNRTLKAAILVAAFGESAAYAQQDLPRDSGVLITLDITTSLRFNDNQALRETSTGDLYVFDTTLGFGIENVTEVSRLALTAEGILRAVKAPLLDLDFTIDDPDVGLEYQRNGAMADFEVAGSISKDDLQFSDPLRETEQLLDNPLVTDTGFIEDRNARISYTMGKSSPFGLTIDGTHFKTLYNDTTDDDLIDTETNQVSVVGRFTISPTIEARVTGSRNRYLADLTRTTDFYGVDFDISVSPIWTVTTGVGYLDIMTTEADGVTQNRISGNSYNLGAARDFENGVFAIDFDSTLSATGRRDTLQVSRNYVADGYNWNWSVGATQGPTNETQYIGSLGYQRELRTGNITLNYERLFGTSDAGNDIQRSRANIQYTYDITAASSLIFGYNYTGIKDAGTGTVDDTSRSEVSLAYNLQVANDFNIRFGGRHIDYYDSNLNDPGTGSVRANSNELFLETVISLARRP